MIQMLEKEIERYYDDHKDEMFASLKELIAIDSSFRDPSEDKPFGEGSAAALEWVQRFGDSLGLHTRNVDNRAVAMDWSDKEPVLAVLSHVDVVPADPAEWTTPPFEMDIRDDCIFGRGSVDDKGPTVAVLYAVRCLKELGVSLGSGLRLVVGGGEELGSGDLEYYQERERLPEMVITPDGSFPVLNCEKGMVHLNFSAPYSGDMSICAGGAINAIPDRCVVSGSGCEKTYTGRAAHGSRPENGDNAITRFLSEYNGADPLLAGLKAFFPYGENDGSSCGLGFEDSITGKMTCALTQLNTRGGRLCGGITPDDMDGMEPHHVPEDSRLVQTLLSIYERVSGRKGECIAEGGITYVHNTSGGVAFGAEYPWEQNNMHGADEHIPLSTFRDNFLMYAHAITELCGAE